MNVFMESSREVLRRFHSSAENGLTVEQTAANRQFYGTNSFTKEKQPSVFIRIFQAAKEPMVLILIVAALITVGVNFVRLFSGEETDFLECAGIFAAIFLSVVITVAMEGKSAKAFEELSKLNEDVQVKVIRGGKMVLIPQKEIVAGDILCIGTGDKIPVDCRLIESTSLKVDESALTGESMPVSKNADKIFNSPKVPLAERSNMLYSGCFITAGSGKAVVCSVGDQTEFGKIARELSSSEKGSTPLQDKMAKLGKVITILGAAAAALVFIVQLSIDGLNGALSFATVLDAFINSIILIVAAVPEGLPTIVAVSLAVNIIKMSKQNALVKKMIACETVGCINVICSDKTGTLTENKMTVTDIYQHGTLIKPEKLSEPFLIENFCVNGTADVHFKGKRTEFIGNPTECALITAANKAGKVYTKYRQEARVCHVFPFSSETKNMTTVLETSKGQLVYSKGSPEKILSMCRISPEERKKAEKMILSFQEKACRVIGFAHKYQSPVTGFDNHRKQIESGLTFDGFVSISDPLRADVRASVERCRRAGIELKMLTGDNIVTAKAIARELGILEGNAIAVEAKDVENLTETEFMKLLPNIRVIARSTPIVKMRVVNALKARGNVVAVTGDGINDAPAIKNADVGIAMGITGTDVSKQASDIVLLDDSFSTIVKAVQWGRGIFENFRRCIQFQLTVNLSSVVVVLFSILAGFRAPFTALELLWINIIMDGPPALTLGLEPIQNNLMDRKPTPRGESIVSKSMLFSIAVNGLFISAVFMLQHFKNFIGGTAEQLPTILFTLFVVFQLFNAFNSRVLSNESMFKGLGKNKLMIAVFLLTFGLQVLITQFGGAMFHTVPLELHIWVKIVATAFSVVLLSEFIKLYKRSGEKEAAKEAAKKAAEEKKR